MLKTAMTFCAVAALATTQVSALELTSNGGFETGDTSDWESFPTANSTFNITSDANSGAWAAEVFNNDIGSSAVIKQANLGIGQVQPGDIIDISFSAKGEGAIGGVVFAEFFSELDGEGVSKAEILGGAPLVLNPNEYTDFSFQAIAGSDVSGGVTLQFATVTGAATGSVSVLFIDDASVSIVPEPASLGLLGAGALALVRRRRTA